MDCFLLLRFDIRTGHVTLLILRIHGAGLAHRLSLAYYDDSTRTLTVIRKRRGNHDLRQTTHPYYHRVMYRYKPHRSIAATLPRALPDATALPPPRGRPRGRRRFLPLGLSAVVALALALVAAGALLPRQAAAPAVAPILPPLDKAVVRTVAVGPVPLDMAVDSGAGRVFVVSRGVISVIDAATGKLLRTTTIMGGGLGAAVAIDARRGRAFIASCGMPGRFGAPSAGTISVLDTRSGRVVRTIRLPAQNIALDAATGRLFVTSGRTFRTSHGRLLAGRVTTLDENGRVLASILPGPFPGAIAVDAATNHVFVTIAGPFFKSPGAAVMFDARSGRALRTIPLWGANGAYLSARTGRVFVTTSYGTVIMLDARSGGIMRTIAGRAPFPFNSLTVAIDDRRGRVYVATGGSVLVLDATTGHVLRTLRVPGDIVAVDAATGHAFVAAQGGQVSVLDLSRR